MRRVIIAGAGGRDFHVFNTVFRDDPEVAVVAFTATQIPNIDDRRYPAELAGGQYPDGIPIRPEAELVELIHRLRADEVVFAYSDVAYPDVMHLSARVLAAGADFRLVGPAKTALVSTRPVIAVCATRTGCGKSQTSRLIARQLRARGLKVALVRHPMPYGDLNAMRVQRFATLADIDASHPTIEEREEYEQPVREGTVVYAGVDYREILTAAEAEADVVLWDGGNNDLPFFRPDLMIVVADALRPGDETRYHPSEANLLLADIVVINKVDVAGAAATDAVSATVARINPAATVVLASSPVTLAEGPSIVGRRVLVVEDGPTITHGGMAFGAGVVAAREGGAAELVDPRPYAVGSLVGVFERFGHIGPVLPAMGYGDTQLDELAATIAATPCDVVVTGTPIDLSAALAERTHAAGPIPHPIRHVTYDLDATTGRELDRLVGDWLDRRADRR